jgi:orotate phosphoribosyltransferase
MSEAPVNEAPVNEASASEQHPNVHCPCSGPGACQRHGVVKTRRKFELCAGINCSTQECQKYWNAWEAGQMRGQTGPVANPLPVGIEPPKRNRGLGDLVAGGIKAATLGLVKPCGGCKQRQDWLNQKFPFLSHPFAFDPGLTPEFVTTARLMEDVKLLVSKLPANTSRIIGVARSGLCAATMAAMLLHRPLSIVRQSAGDVIDGGNGWRLTGHTTDVGPAVVIDDTCMTGNSFKQVLPVVRQQFPNAVAAAVYVNPNANVKPDLWARELPWPHLLEWNLFNSVIAPHMAVDFDGILCRDCGPGEDDDGPNYADFLEHATPLYYVRRTVIPLIVTGRLEKYRPQTMSWLARHGMAVNQLLMWPGANHHERNRSDVGGWKGQHFKNFLKQRHRVQPPVFVESDARQAQRIAQVSQGVVVCPAAGRCFR